MSKQQIKMSIMRYLSFTGAMAGVILTVWFVGMALVEYSIYAINQ